MTFTHLLFIVTHSAKILFGLFALIVVTTGRTLIWLDNRKERKAKREELK
jgi:hypothetical protein